MAGLLRAVLDLDEAIAEDVAELAEQYGVPWFARIAGAIAAPEPAAARGCPRRTRAATAGVRCCVVGIGAVRRLRAGDPDPADFEDLAARCRSLDAPALEAWARAGMALAAVAAQLPEAARDAESAVGFAHSAQVPGASAVAWAALGLARHDRDLVATAAAEADALGLGCRPWELVIPSRPEPVLVGPPVAPLPVEVRCFGGFDIRVSRSRCRS